MVQVFRTFRNENKDVFYLKLFDGLGADIHDLLQLKQGHDITKGPNLFFEYFSERQMGTLCEEFLCWVEGEHLREARALEADNKRFAVGRRDKSSPNKDAWKFEYHGAEPGQAEPKTILTFDQLEARTEAIRQAFEDKYLERVAKHETLLGQAVLQRGKESAERLREKREKEDIVRGRIISLRENEHLRRDKVKALTKEKLERAERARQQGVELLRQRLLSEKDAR